MTQVAPAAAVPTPPAGPGAAGAPMAALPRVAADGTVPGIAVCPTCDALIQDRRPARGERIRCPRCGTLMRTARPGMIDALLALAFTVPPLMAVGLGASFISLSGGGAVSEASVLQAAFAISEGNVWFLGIACGALIAALPVLRAAALAYALVPLRLGRPAPHRAASAIRLFLTLRPWSMAEIFVIGVAVAMVKLTGLATVSLGPAFWAFAVLGLVALAEDAVLCPRSLLDALHDEAPAPDPAAARAAEAQEAALGAARG
ncbi:MAG: paraquat-inducible protein A [Pseudomonadota bacterium]